MKDRVWQEWRRGEGSILREMVLEKSSPTEEEKEVEKCINNEGEDGDEKDDDICQTNLNKV